ncbi:MAG: NrpR regulatory domain-containing protein [Chloroflexi bacterium]|nr:NrpR regulatory domain-containing protein [Chloroflexota bacterium]
MADILGVFTQINMTQDSSFETERKIIAILKVLSESSEPMGSIIIARELERYGISLGERAVRYHLKITDERGYTRSLGRDGRVITSKGLEELKIALAPGQIGFILERLELLAFRTTFNPDTKTGQLAINTSIFDRNTFKEALLTMQEVFKAKLCVSDLVAVADQGEKLGDVVIPYGKIGFATVCGVTINGVMLKAGIPIESKFGGVLELLNSIPKRFTAIISYSGTTLDPSEQYIRARMTSVREAARSGNGRILANFREIPAPARSMVEEMLKKLNNCNIRGVYVLGNISEPVCQITTGLNRVGMVLLGGLNPQAAASESGINVESIAESGMIEYNQLVSFWELLAKY